MKSQELSSVLTLLKVLSNYDEFMNSTYREPLYDNLTERMNLAQGIDAGLSILSLHYVGLPWDEFYDKVDTKASFNKYGMFIPDQIYNLVTYKNSDLDEKQVLLLFKQAKPLISKGIKNDKTRKTRTKRAK
jgi:hypothetical protein